MQAALPAKSGLEYPLRGEPVELECCFPRLASLFHVGEVLTLHLALQGLTATTILQCQKALQVIREPRCVMSINGAVKRRDGKK